jgi:hypothetical protein
MLNLWKTLRYTVSRKRESFDILSLRHTPAVRCSDSTVLPRTQPSSLRQFTKALLTSQGFDFERDVLKDFGVVGNGGECRRRRRTK